MRIQIDEIYSLRTVTPEKPGKDSELVLEKLGWVVVDGIREEQPLTMAVYASRVLLVRDLVSDSVGRQVLSGKMDTIASYVSETRRIAELAQVAFDELTRLRANNV
ncbi:DUF5405 family protein [Pantoea sp. PNT02]|uniref:DUF5405 family protein n=1 Tax=Pantoea sp. PNT02 TaxID=2769261 RepID=UPI0017803F60|nr:DUF5405 family protein [Pantoea sp. PNT02]MBD9643622.1 DUF5405 family protein [Pantoea sp. PNT02]